MLPARPGGAVAITGFTAFPGVPDNPSARLVKTLRAGAAPLPPSASFHLLNVSYKAVSAALDDIFADEPAVLLMTGYSARAEGLRLERRAHDFISPDSADAFGLRGGGEKVGEVLMPTRLDLSAMAECVRNEGIACAVSNDAGAYLCNFIYHQALKRISRQASGTVALFVHVPAIIGTPLARTSAGAIPLATIAEGVALIAARLAGVRKADAILTATREQTHS